MSRSRRGASEAYVALGDSISIDVYAGGRGRGGASLLARNRDDDFPEWRGRDLATTRPDLAFRLLATDGGTTASLLDVQLPRLVASGAVPRVVTLTVGGNDVLVAYGDTRRALEIVSVGTGAGNVVAPPGVVQLCAVSRSSPARTHPGRSNHGK